MLFKRENRISFTEFSTEEIKAMLTTKHEQMKMANENFEFEYTRILKNDIDELEGELVRRESKEKAN